MKALILLREEGVSGLVWRLHLDDFLKRGRRVLVVRASPLSYQSSAFEEDIPAHPHLAIRDAGAHEAQALMREMQELPADMVVMWQLPLFAWAAADEHWRMLVRRVCARMAQDMVLVFSVKGQDWFTSANPTAAGLLAVFDWDYLVGEALCASGNTPRVEELFPQLACPGGLNDDAFQPGRWQVSTRGTYLDMGTDDESDTKFDATLASNPQVHVAQRARPPARPWWKRFSFRLSA